MNWKVLTITVLGVVGSSVAEATVVTSDFCFGPSNNCTTVTGSSAPSPTQVSSGTSFTGSNGGTITVYADQANSSGVFVTPVTNTESGLFEVNDKYNSRGVGIAPYNPSEGTSSGTYSTQDGLTDSVSGASSNDNFILLDLGSNIAQGSTISFLLQAGVSGDTFDVYTGTSTQPTSFGGMTKANSSPVQVTEGGTSQPNGTSSGQLPQFSITKTTAGNEWVAISADCHYLLLDQVITSYSGVPEPRFYGLLMAGMLGLAGIYARKRQAAAAGQVENA